MKWLIGIGVAIGAIIIGFLIFSKPKTTTQNPPPPPVNSGTAGKNGLFNTGINLGPNFGEQAGALLGSIGNLFGGGNSSSSTSGEPSSAASAAAATTA